MHALRRLASDLRDQAVVQSLGWTTSLSDRAIGVKGLSRACGVGDMCLIWRGKTQRRGEVISVSDDEILVLPEGPVDAFRVGDPVVRMGPRAIRPTPAWLGRIVDPDGVPFDGQPLELGEKRSLIARPPAAHLRRPMGPVVSTGLAAFDCLLPLARGQRIGLFAGAGVGKSTLIAQLAATAEADVVVLAMIGERGREVGNLFNRLLDARTRKRTLVIAATSDQPPALRRHALASAVTVSEYFRDQGKHVLLLVDSMTRFAEAHREIALHAGERPALRGHPPSLVPSMAALVERVGPGAPGAGDITAVFSVLVAGNDLDEPVSDTLRGLLDGHWILSRDIAERGRFPAIDVLASVSRALPDVTKPEELALIADARDILAKAAEARLMVQSGLYHSGSDVDLDRVLRLHPALETFLGSRPDIDRPQMFRDLSAILRGQEEDQPIDGTV